MRDCPYIKLPVVNSRQLPVLTSLLVSLLFSVSVIHAADWNTITHNDLDSDTLTSVAIVKNNQGFTLEIYKDSVNAIRARFSLGNNLISFPDNFCPTFQIDKGSPKNRSINDAPCLSDDTWAEFILGYVENNHVESDSIAGLMNGVNLRFRFMLKNGDYRETLFSLLGSKRAMSTALGENVQVSSVKSR